MSLLMEALRKAEEEKNERAPEQPVSTTPVDGPPEAEEDSLLVLDLPDLQENRSEPLVFEHAADPKGVAQKAAEAPAEEDSPPAEAPSPEVLEPEGDQGEKTAGNGSEQQMARALFQAKTRARRRRLWLGLLTAAASLLLAALGAWYILAIQEQQGVVLVPAVSPATVGEPEAAAAAALEEKRVPEGVAPEESRGAVETAVVGDAGTQAQDAPQVAAETEAVASGSRPSQPEKPKTAAAGEKVSVAPSSVKPEPRQPAPSAPATAREAYRKAMDRAAGASGRNPEIRIRRSSRKAERGSPLRKAWQAFQEGRYREAERLYAAVLKKEPLNRDALLGLAAIAVATGDAGTAQDFYLRLLERDPRDPLAQAGMVSLEGARDPVQAIARVQQLISANPDRGGLHFILGNLYAVQKRWSYAQKAYFKAYSGDPGNPDYLFNLAVSLDHLGKHRQALDFYRQALEQAKQRRARFSAQAVSRRVEALAAAGERP